MVQSWGGDLKLDATCMKQLFAALKDYSPQHQRTATLPSTFKPNPRTTKLVEYADFAALAANIVHSGTELERVNRFAYP